MITAFVASLILAASTAPATPTPLATRVSAATSASHQRFLPMNRARARARVAAREIARINPLTVKWPVGACTRRSRGTVDCIAQFKIDSHPPCDLLIRVRYASRSSRRTVATYPHDPVCLGG